VKLALIAALASTSCLATSGDLERIGAEVGERIEAVARSAEESAAAAREAWRKGDISYTELQARLQDIRSATLDVAKETTEQVVREMRETIEARPEVVGDVARTVIPGPWGEALAILVASGGAYVAASRRAREEAERINRARDAARLARGERVTQGPPQP
jgi:nicotinamide mononucleotide (NMN) deamidase PncC